MVVGTYDAVGTSLRMTAAWAGICCSEPPCLTVGIRESRLTYENLLRPKSAHRAFPLGGPGEGDGLLRARLGRNEDKLAKTGMNLHSRSEVDAPVIDRFPLVLRVSPRVHHENSASHNARGGGDRRRGGGGNRFLTPRES